MASSNLFLFTIFIAVVFATIGVVTANTTDDAPAAPPAQEDVVKEDDPRFDSFTPGQLKAKISSLERQIEHRSKDVRAKDKVIADKEQMLVNLMGPLDKENEDLRLKVDALGTKLRRKTKENKRLKTQITEAAKRETDLNTEVANLRKVIDGLRKVNDDLETKFRSHEQAWKRAEEEKAKELMKLYGAWLPPWLATRFTHYQLFVEKTWDIHGRPRVDLVTQKALEKKACIDEWATIHIEKSKAKWGPVIQRQWVVIEPHVRTVATKTIATCRACNETITPRLIQVADAVNPYFLGFWKVSKPYIDRVVTATKPLVIPVHTALKPYTQPAVRTCGKFLESATTYHHQVEEKVQARLEGHELTKPLATKELVWFSASSLLALPIIFLMRVCSAIFRYA